nr:MAG: RNA-dependent RNA polymerase [Aspergillus flavus virga-like virus 1]
MPTLSEFGAKLNLPVEDMVRLGERQVLDPQSAIFRAIAQEAASKLAALYDDQHVERSRKQRTRVYIQHAVSNEERYQIVREYPGWDIRFSGTDRRSAALAHAAFTCAFEYMLDMLNVKRGNLVVYGVSLKQIVMRGRHWIHLCVPGHSAEAQVEHLREDGAIYSMVNSLASKGKEPALARKYIEGKARVHCTNPTTCNIRATAGIAMFHKTDTNLRQVAFFMRQHQLKVLMYGIPYGKNAELKVRGPIDPLGAYCMPAGDYIDVVYKHDSSLSVRYTYMNYLELVARTQVILDGMCYHKEFVGYKLGVAMYKVSCFPADYADEEVSPYKSWVEPNYRDYYMVRRARA